MISIEQALNLIEENSIPLDPCQLSLVDCVGHVLAKDILSQGNSPPYDKSMMDGFALRSEDIKSKENRLEIIERILAGMVPVKTIRSGQASQIMTGAPVPKGCDSVVMVEQTKEESSGNQSTVQIQLESVTVGQNILKQGSVFREGDSIVAKGHLIRAHDIGVLAEIGCETCEVVRAPNVAIVATGDELVPHENTPGAGQIRNSNGPMLECMAKVAGATVQNLGVAIDQRAEIESRIQWGLGNDILLLTGGVSAGTADFVPNALETLGVKKVFHKVAVKPGKPIWFGVFESDDHRCLVFGLPGNPASSMVGFQVFVKLAIERLKGRKEKYPVFEPAFLDKTFNLRGDRTAFWPSTVSVENGKLICTPQDWRGSADVRAIVRANCLARFSPEIGEYNVGDQVEVLRMAN